MEPLALDLTLIDLVVVGGLVVVLPIALGGAWRWWAVASISLVASFLVEPGVAAASLTVPWVVTGVAVAQRSLRTAGPLLFWTIEDGASAVAHLWGMVAAGGMVVSRWGLVPFGIREPIVELTAVHYTYAGVGALTLAAMAHRTAATPRTRMVGRAAVLVTMAAPPVVALGFLTKSMLPQVGGAALMAVGVWLTAGLQLTRVVRHRAAGWTGVLLGISGLAIWAPMVVAVAWAAGQHWAIPILSIPDMARTHGLANALGFTLCGLIARHLDREVEA